jgi:hypothetical protein
MAMIPLIGPGGLCTREPLPVSSDETCRTICEPGEQDVMQMRQKKQKLTFEFEGGGHCQGIPVQSSPYLQLWLAGVLHGIETLAVPQYCSMKFNSQWYFG